MKNLMLITLFSFLGFAVVTAQSLTSNAETAVPTAEIAWNQTTIDLGTIQQNIPAKATFTLTNNSKQPLIIKEVKTSCGCTAAGYKQEAIAPGESTEITATYNAKKVGKFAKTLKVFTTLDTKGMPLVLKGEVTEAKP